MHKILASWSGMRKYLEQEMLAESLKGRVRYGCTSYIGMDGCRIFELCIDGEQFKRFSHETVNTYFINNGFKEQNPHSDNGEYWSGYWSLLGQYTVNDRTEYTDVEFCEALATYRSQPIQDSICSANPLVRMFAVLDRRTGKRTLLRMRSELDLHPDWLQQIYRLRFSADGI